MKVVLGGALSGLLFALGLGIAGMTDPARVVGFLDVTGDWDPSLMAVMGGALVTHGVALRLIYRRARPVFTSTFPVLARSPLDRRLVVGSALFGAGWGLAGYCPGPALTSLASGAPTVLMFVAAMALGTWGVRVWQARCEARDEKARAGGLVAAQDGV